jgi:hypothetical protein
MIMSKRNVLLGCATVVLGMGAGCAVQQEQVA